MNVKICNRSIVQQLKLGKLFLFSKPVRNQSTNAVGKEYECDLLVVGGGAGGCSIAAKFARQKELRVIVVEPKKEHYYQPMFTLIAAGIKTLPESVKPMKQILPPAALWLCDRIKQFYPDDNSVRTANDNVINYKFMVISCGIELNYDKVAGLPEALDMKDSGVCSIYSPEYAVKTYDTLQNLRVGNAVFTFPNSLIKCAGAPLKVCYLAEHFTRLNKRRGGIKFTFNTSLPVIFAAKYYADGLVKLCSERNIDIGYRKELIAVKPEKKEATFRNLEKTLELETVNYSMLHATPPMSTPAELKNATTLVDKAGYLNVDKWTLQHVQYKNIFGIGDCTNLPTSKTAAAAAAQGKVLHTNLSLAMKHQPFSLIYNGYTSCPLVTGYGKCILAEFDYERNPLETFPIDQRKEWALSYYLKKDVLPQIYWWGMKGYWNGPEMFRKICHLGFTN